MKVPCSSGYPVQVDVHQDDEMLTSTEGVLGGFGMVHYVELFTLGDMSLDLSH